MASLEDAAKYGGDVTRSALMAISLTGTYKYVTVDTKVHMLMPGMNPSIPGWHTDGVPRDENNRPIGPDVPDQFRQEELRSPKYHLMVLGESDSRTEFVAHPLMLDMPVGGSYDMYRMMSEQVEANTEKTTFAVEYGQIATFGWWDMHRGIPAQSKGWRFLIRVTESDYLAPLTDLRSIIRTQIQAYVTPKFGW
jgi:hypothetical protein